MSKRKGLSVEEKRQKMMELFYEKKDFFQLKDLEKICPKEKGIVAQSVKEIVQSLVDDGMVDSEKIGTSIYFWAFPSKAANQRKRKMEDLNEKVTDSEKKFAVLSEKAKKARVGKEKTGEREELAQQLDQLKTDLSKVQLELSKYKDCDPEVLEEMQKETKVAKEAANRWTDNIFTIKQWCKNKFCIEEGTLNKQFEIPEELDYLE